MQVLTQRAGQLNEYLQRRAMHGDGVADTAAAMAHDRALAAK